jgi:large subunit ribosomal protein L32
MAVPKRRTSKSKIRSRKASAAHKRPLVASQPCPKCGKAQLPHRICTSCGYYKGRQVKTVEAD